MSFYNDPKIFSPPMTLGNQFYLSLDNSNGLLDSLGMIRGANNHLSWYYEGDNRTGGYWHGLGVLGFSSLGFTCGTWGVGQLSVWNKLGHAVELLVDPEMASTASLALPSASGTLARLEDLDSSKEAEYTYTTLVDDEDEIIFSGYEMHPNTVAVYFNGVRQNKTVQVEVFDTYIEIQTLIPAGTIITWHGVRK